MTTYAMGTSLEATQPWGTFTGGRVLCADGQVRPLKRIAATADTFFSIPASVTVGRRTVAGYVTVETVDGLSTETDDNLAVAKFIAYTYRANADALPSGAYRREATR